MFTIKIEGVRCRFQSIDEAWLAAQWALDMGVDTELPTKDSVLNNMYNGITAEYVVWKFQNLSGLWR